MLTQLGTVWIALGDRGVLRLASDEDELTFSHEIELTYGCIPEYRPDVLAGALGQLAKYFSGRATTFDLPIDLGVTTSFQRTVLEAVRDVPYGTVQSYGEIAAAVGRPGAARAVGTAVATNPISVMIPCHRIIRSDGSCGEYAWRALGHCGAVYKLALLALEGFHFSDTLSSPAQGL
jgi:methylated-DNA-[protein]-cysteine S-methyltransferase